MCRLPRNSRSLNLLDPHGPVQGLLLLLRSVGLQGTYLPCFHVTTFCTFFIHCWLCEAWNGSKISKLLCDLSLPSDRAKLNITHKNLLKSLPTGQSAWATHSTLAGSLWGLPAAPLHQATSQHSITQESESSIFTCIHNVSPRPSPHPASPTLTDHHLPQQHLNSRIAPLGIFAHWSTSHEWCVLRKRRTSLENRLLTCVERTPIGPRSSIRCYTEQESLSHWNTDTDY